MPWRHSRLGMNALLLRWGNKVLNRSIFIVTVPAIVHEEMGSVPAAWLPLCLRSAVELAGAARRLCVAAAFAEHIHTNGLSRRRDPRTLGWLGGGSGNSWDTNTCSCRMSRG